MTDMLFHACILYYDYYVPCMYIIPCLCYNMPACCSIAYLLYQASTCICIIADFLQHVFECIIDPAITDTRTILMSKICNHNFSNLDKVCLQPTTEYLN